MLGLHSGAFSMFKLLITLLVLTSANATIVSLAIYQTPVRNQLDRNTCAYFAVTALIESTIKNKFNKSFDISEQFQIFYGKEHFNEYSNKEHASTYEIGLNFQKQYFFMKEADFPYENSFFGKNRPCASEDPLDESAPSTCFSQGPLKWSFSQNVKISGLKIEWISGMWSFGKSRAQLLQASIDNKRPVVITVKVYAPLWDKAHVSYTDEDDKKCEAGIYDCYGHAVLLTGYDTKKEVFIFKNSWGTSWGNKGYGTISFDYINKFSDMPITAYFENILADLREQN